MEIIPHILKTLFLQFRYILCLKKEFLLEVYAEIFIDEIT